MTSNDLPGQDKTGMTFAWKFEGHGHGHPYYYIIFILLAIGLFRQLRNFDRVIFEKLKLLNSFEHCYYYIFVTKTHQNRNFNFLD